VDRVLANNNNFVTRKSSLSHPAKRRKQEKTSSPRNMKACHIIGTALQR
jgi:hypothetical protein